MKKVQRYCQSVSGNCSQSQRRVTFHLPDGSQESCSDSGLGDHELLSHPLPLVQGQVQDDFYQQASPDKRTEADGNSDPNSGTKSVVPPQPVLMSPSQYGLKEMPEVVFTLPSTILDTHVKPHKHK
ncbi:hypothetical protein DPEC_G00147110 [Dallia pectoralis]|uniref:Uncharacterized protein n=1 Tax=Dallia pectoralis TaxID=75939 RepID=A0ACC2GIF0_DALPE|nr:hypothetical protein DPEC_G00147110 [Dallia pectoralis]